MPAMQPSSSTAGVHKPPMPQCHWCSAGDVPVRRSATASPCPCSVGRWPGCSVYVCDPAMRRDGAGAVTRTGINAVHWSPMRGACNTAALPTCTRSEAMQFSPCSQLQASAQDALRAWHVALPAACRRSLCRCPAPDGFRVMGYLYGTPEHCTL
jgi:hypothetical protein